MNYLQLLEHSFSVEKEISECAPSSRLAYLSLNVFDFTTYDSEIDELFASKAVEVCAAISNKKTFEYIKDAENYKWFLVMCNMPFFADRITWGSSIRAAWWDYKIADLESCGLFDGDEQLTEPIQFSEDEWRAFIAAVIEFAGQPQE